MQDAAVALDIKLPGIATPAPSGSLNARPIVAQAGEEDVLHHELAQGAALSAAPLRPEGGAEAGQTDRDAALAGEVLLGVQNLFRGCRQVGEERLAAAFL